MNKIQAHAYRIQDGCHNCRWCDVHHPYDDPIVYSCMFWSDLSPEPPPNYNRWDGIGVEGNPNWEHTIEKDKWRVELPEVDAAGMCEFYENRKKWEK